MRTTTSTIRPAMRIGGTPPAVAASERAPGRVRNAAAHRCGVGEKITL